ncbi:hypothetical protein [Streptomyces echinatus]|uniref:Uncharacterized protein n=1 Tax=Streptomyces echinatus TaxID=67293 RepID=A0A7W9UPV8_9ACTN|nr:hypothetical protein [Streptomyces echinatus]MBB5926762.1 hypothetical protein [Streptomyces echinatus]
MGQLVLSGRIRGEATTQCEFTISVNGSAVSATAVVLDQSVFTVPDASAQIEIQAASFEPATYGTVGARLEIDAFGSVQPTFLPDGWEPPTVLPSPLGLTTVMVVHFSPLRDATETARRNLAQSGPDYPGSPPAPPPGDMTFRSPPVPMPPDVYSPLPQVTDTAFIGSPPIADGRIAVEQRTVTPFGEVLVLRLPGVGAPQLVAVFWPAEVPRQPGAPPAPFLVFFRPAAAQNVPNGFFKDPRDRHDPMTNDTYPWGWDYQFFGLLRPLRYMGDPLLEFPSAKGLVHQIQASGRKVVLVLPLPRADDRTCDEITSFGEAVFLQEYLEEIQAFMFRRAGNFSFGPIGRLAMGSFSSGHALLSCFLTNPANQNHPLLLDTLQEIYLFDPHADQVSVTRTPLTHVAAWATRGAAATKIARLYTQNDPVQLAPVLSLFGMVSGQAPAHAETPDGRKSLTALPMAAWKSLAERLQGSVPYTNSAQVHEVIPALMLTDALRRSGF